MDYIDRPLPKMTESIASDRCALAERKHILNRRLLRRHFELKSIELTQFVRKAKDDQSAAAG